MGMPKRYKTVIIIVLSILVLGLLPGVALVWAEAGPDSTQVGLASGSFVPLGQEGEESGVRPLASTDDMIVQIGADPGQITGQSDGSGIEIVPASAFVHTGGVGGAKTGTEADDWFFDFDGGFVRNDSANFVCMMAPVYLPPGSIIDSFTVYLVDNSASNLTVYLDKVDVIDGWVELGRVTSSGSSASIQTLTDPAIVSDNGANTVSTVAVNFYVDFCFPNSATGTSLRLNAARVNYSAPANITFLPIVIKGIEEVGGPTRVYITNNTGGSLTYTIFNTPQGNISCVIANGANDVPCGNPFTSGFYDWLVVTVCDPPTASGTKKHFPPPEKHLSAFFCIR